MGAYAIDETSKNKRPVYTKEESTMMAYKPNLLLNGDFKCNSGGHLVYENPAYTAQDSIDKWKIMAGKVNTSFVNYLTIESYNEAGSSYFLQNFDSEKSGDFVISLKVLNINKGSFRVYFEGTNQQDSYTISSKGIYKITFRDVKNATGVCLALDNFSGDIEYIRLDEGTVPLPHMKEDYEIASLRCGQNKKIEQFIFLQSDVITATVGGSTSWSKKVKEMVSIPDGYKIAQVTYVVDGSNSSNNCISNIIGLNSSHDDDNIVILLRNTSSSQLSWRLSAKVLAVKA